MNNIKIYIIFLLIGLGMNRTNNISTKYLEFHEEWGIGIKDVSESTNCVTENQYQRIKSYLIQNRNYLVINF